MSVSGDGEILEIGMSVEAKYRGIKFRQCSVTNIRADGTVDVTYTDGDQVKKHAFTFIKPMY